MGGIGEERFAYRELCVIGAKIYEFFKRGLTKICRYQIKVPIEWCKNLEE
jgi:hypothetical protein